MRSCRTISRDGSNRAKVTGLRSGDSRGARPRGLQEEIARHVRTRWFIEFSLGRTPESSSRGQRSPMRACSQREGHDTGSPGSRSTPPHGGRCCAVVDGSSSQDGGCCEGSSGHGSSEPEPGVRLATAGRLSPELARQTVVLLRKKPGSLSSVLTGTTVSAARRPHRAWGRKRFETGLDGMKNPGRTGRGIRWQRRGRDPDPSMEQGLEGEPCVREVLTAAAGNS